MPFSVCSYFKKSAQGTHSALLSVLSLAASAAVAPFVLAACSQTTTPQLPSSASATPGSLVKEYQPPPVPIYALATRVSKYHEVVIYGAPDSSGPVTIPLDGLYVPFPIAIDAHATVYVADYGEGGSHRRSSVTEWHERHSGPIRTITAGIAYPIAIAATSTGRLYVANDFGGKAGTITVYAARSVKPLRTITKGVKAPSAVSADASGYVYVANPGSLCPGGGSIAEYPPHARGPAVVIKGICQPSQLAIDSSDDLYVNGLDYGDVGEYAPHSATLLRTLSLTPSWNVISIALDPLGNLYVTAHQNIGSDFFGKIFEYGPTGTESKRTISLGRNIPWFIVTDRYANLYALIGPWSGAQRSLVEFPSGQKGRVVIAKSSKTTVITGPIAVAP